LLGKFEHKFFKKYLLKKADFSGFKDVKSEDYDVEEFFLKNENKDVHEKISKRT